MKILYLNYEFPPIGGGGSPVSYEIAKGYVRCGHEVDVVTMSYGDLPEFENVEGINIFRVKCLRTKKEICHPWEQLTYLVSAKSFLSKHLKSVRYDMNHTHFIIPTGVLALWVKRKFNIPYIMTAHGSDVLGYNKRFALLYPLLKRPWEQIVRNARCVTAPSDFLIQKIRQITQQGTFHTIANGLDLTRFSPMKKEKKILVVARLFPNKGIQDILDALNGINLGKWSVDIVGDGPYLDVLVNRVRTYGLEGKVKFRGWIDNASKEMKELYGKAVIFISASHFESFGLTVLEALSAGCYPLISDIGGHRFVVRDDRYFFQKGNIEDLRGKIISLIQMQPDDFSVNIDIERFDWNNVIKDYISLLES
jgi:glycosyltransferase involved in cell wall biosynthesis